MADSKTCGFGTLIATKADKENCFSRAIGLAPDKTKPTVVPSVGSVGIFYWRGCHTDDDGKERPLAGGFHAEAADMTVERCVALAKDHRYAAVEFST